MNESNLISNRNVECLTTVQDEKDIPDIINNMIKRVEQMTCSKLPDSTTDDSEVLNGKNGQVNYSKPTGESSIDRSKHRSGSRKHRVRHRKHKWKPYHKMTGDERRRLEERLSRRAYISRQRMSASGLMLAPYNTTQFLMDDHNFRQPEYDIDDITHPEDYNSSERSKEDCNSSEDFYSSPDDEKEFMQQQFSETYETFHNALISEMSKSDLVKELIRLEDEIDATEQTLRDLSREAKTELDVEAEMEKIQVFQDEIEKLAHENLLLEQRHEELENRLSRIGAVL